VKYDFIVWNTLIKTSEKDYFDKYGYLFEKNEFLSDKLKKYNITSV
jgi:hypothetical protein